MILELICRGILELACFCAEYHGVGGGSCSQLILWGDYEFIAEIQKKSQLFSNKTCV